MLPQKKDNSLEAILETIRRGDWYDYENVFARVDDEVTSPSITGETAFLCCDVIEALVDKYKGDASLSPLVLCTKVIDECDGNYTNNYVPTIDIAKRAIYIFHDGLKKEIKGGSERALMKGMPLMWFVYDAVNICADNNESNVLSKACVKLSETLAKTSVAEIVVDSFVGYIESNLKRSKPLSHKELPYQLAHLIPFVKSTNENAAVKAKKCLKEFLKNFWPPKEKNSQTPLLEDIQKQVLKLNL